MAARMDTRVSRIGTLFKVAEFTGNTGDIRVIDFPVDAPRDRMDHVSIYTDGLFMVRNADGVIVSKREAGDISTDFPDVPAGQYTLEAVRDGSRSLCIFPREDGMLFRAEKALLKAGDEITFRVGRSYLLCKGSIAINGVERQQGWAATVTTAGNKGKALTDAIFISMWR